MIQMNYLQMMEQRIGSGEEKKNVAFLYTERKGTLFCLKSIATTNFGFLNNRLNQLCKSSPFRLLCLFECLFNPLRSHWELIQPGAGCVEDSVGDDRTNRDDRRFAATLRGQLVVFD